jgi:hypothetical protein
MKKVMVMCLSLLSSGLLAEESGSEYMFNGKLGVSPYTGFLGLEVQKGKWSLGVGFPASVSVKRYQYENEDSLFYGVYWNNLTDNRYDDYEEGILFDKYERESYGVGVGYMWLWESGWNTSTGLSVGEYKKEYTNANLKYFEEGYNLNLELSVGYKF